MIDRLFSEDNPRPALRVLGKKLAKTEAGVLILEENGARIDEFLSVLSQHLVNGRGIIHIRERVAVCSEGIADPLEFAFDRLRLVKDNEDTFFF